MGRHEFSTTSHASWPLLTCRRSEIIRRNEASGSAGQNESTRYAVLDQGKRSTQDRSNMKKIVETEGTGAAKQRGQRRQRMYAKRTQTIEVYDGVSNGRRRSL